MSSSSICFENEKEREEMIMFLLRGRIHDLNSIVDDLSSQIEHMVPRSELELEKRHVAKWKRRADVAFTARVKEKKLRQSLIRSHHSVSMENQRLRAKFDALKALLVL
nr:hypothetical protein [Tanacetum cinerariifolium]